MQCPLRRSRQGAQLRAPPGGGLPPRRRPQLPLPAEAGRPPDPLPLATGPRPLHLLLEVAAAGALAGQLGRSLRLLGGAVARVPPRAPRAGALARPAAVSKARLAADAVEDAQAVVVVVLADRQGLQLLLPLLRRQDTLDILGQALRVQQRGPRRRLLAGLRVRLHGVQDPPHLRLDLLQHLLRKPCLAGNDVPEAVQCAEVKARGGG
mmetsp:Transcript_22433/g.63666  ORF Transcript_22433/g.63666 Transcript_22433/m.63666 type:complete len:208 (-) Transcript_22433:293-916(-)